MSGQVEIGGGFIFRWMVQGEKTPEIYGWVEDGERRPVKGTGGWYRTTDPHAAAQHARMAIP